MMAVSESQGASQSYERLLPWSGDKDAAFVLADKQALLTTYDEATRLLPHTRIPFDPVEAQASGLGLPPRRDATAPPGWPGRAWGPHA